MIFPGIGYGIDRPLLYYTGKIAQECGYRVINTRYSGISKECLKDPGRMPEAFELAVKQTEEQLREADLASYEDVLFISKSIGTVAAGIYADRYDIPARQVFYTPFAQSFTPAVEGNGIVFFGDRDPWVIPEEIRNHCIAKKMDYTVIEGGNHSLETGHVHTDVENIRTIIYKTEDFIASMTV